MNCVLLGKTGGTYQTRNEVPTFPSFGEKRKSEVAFGIAYAVWLRLTVSGRVCNNEANTQLSSRDRLPEWLQFQQPTSDFKLVLKDCSL